MRSDPARNRPALPADHAADVGRKERPRGNVGRDHALRDKAGTVRATPLLLDARARSNTLDVCCKEVRSGSRSPRLECRSEPPHSQIESPGASSNAPNMGMQPTAATTGRDASSNAGHIPGIPSPKVRSAKDPHGLALVDFLERDRAVHGQAVARHRDETHGENA